MYNLPKYGDTILVDLGAGEFIGSVHMITEDELEISTDGGDTTQTVWLDDIINITVLERY